MTPIGMATPKVKSEHVSDDDDSLQKQIRAVVRAGHASQAARTGKQRRKGQGRRVKLRLGRDLHDAAPGRPRDTCTAVPATSKWVATVLCIDVLFFQRNRVYEICQRGDRHRHFKAA